MERERLESENDEGGEDPEERMRYYFSNCKLNNAKTNFKCVIKFIKCLLLLLLFHKF